MENDVALTYEKLYELLRREKGKEDLQLLDNVFFLQVVAYLREKDTTYSMSLTKNDVFSMNERQRLQTELHNIHRLVKELYERREKKILEMALNRSRTSANIIDTTSLLPEERAMFDQLVSNMDHFRVGVLQNILTLKDPSVSITTLPLRLFNEPTIPRGEAPKKVVIEHPSFVPPTAVTPTPAIAPTITAPVVSVSSSGASVSAAAQSASTHINANQLNVRFIQEVPQVVDSDMATFGPFNANDTAIIPREIAEIWIEQGACVEQK